MAIAIFCFIPTTTIIEKARPLPGRNLVPLTLSRSTGVLFFDRPLNPSLTMEEKGVLTPLRGLEVAAFRPKCGSG